MTNQTATHYDALCVPPTASAEEIKSSWRRLIRAFHPDIAGDSGIVFTQRLNEAYSAVGTPAARRAYDRDLALNTEPEPEPTVAPKRASTASQPADQPQGTPAAAAGKPSEQFVVWDGGRYQFLGKVIAVAWAVICVATFVAAIMLDRSHSSFWLVPIVSAALLTALRQRMAKWRAVVLAVAIAAAPLGALNVWVFSAWLADAGYGPLILQGILAVAALIIRPSRNTRRVLRAVRPTV